MGELQRNYFVLHIPNKVCECDFLYKENFPKRLKKARVDAGYTQPQVSVELKISSGTLSKYENGKLEPDLEKLAMLAEFYAISIDWLLGIGRK